MADLRSAQFPKPGYRSQSEDTSVEIDFMLFTRLKQLSLLQKVERFATLNYSARQLLWATLPGPNPLERRRQYCQRRLGQMGCLEYNDRGGELVIIDPITLTLKIANILAPLGIAYYVGGSVASSIYGESRQSEDIDIVIEITPFQSQPFIEALIANNFYVSATAVEEALSSADPLKSFNALDNESIEKVDFFLVKQDPFARSKMERRRRLELPQGPIYLCSPEDIILQKLLWGRRSQSEKQWRDVLGVLKVQAGQLDYGYLADWATQLSLADRLNQALLEAGI